MELLHGKPVAEKLEKELTAEIGIISARFDEKPFLQVLQYNDDPSSKAYLSRIKSNCEKYGIGFDLKTFSGGRESEFEAAIAEANQNRKISAIMVQHPLPRELEYCIDMIAPEKDVEGVTSGSLGKILIGGETLLPCTAEAVVEILDFYEIGLSGKKAVVIGRSNIVGKPLALLLLQKNATVTVCHSKTSSLERELSDADIIVVSIGKAGFIKGGMIPKDCVVIDVGINYVDGKLVGDVDFDSVKDHVSKITPVPGGVGVVTNMSLIRNIIKSFRMQKGDAND